MVEGLSNMDTRTHKHARVEKVEDDAFAIRQLAITRRKDDVR